MRKGCLSVRPVRQLRLIAPLSIGSDRNTVRQLSILFEGKPLRVVSRRALTSSTVIVSSFIRFFSFLAPFGAVIRAFDYETAKALLAAPFAFSAKLVVFLSASFIKKERPLSLEVFRHTGHRHHLLPRPLLSICSRNAEMPEISPQLCAFGAISGIFLRYERCL